MSTHRPPTQVFSRKKLASEATPPFVSDAEQRMEKGDYAGARAALEEGLRQHGRSVEALLGLAEAYWDDPDTKARDPKRSIDFLKEAIQLAPKDARPYALLGRYLLSKGLRDQALNFLDRAIQLDPNDGASRRLRDRASLQKKKQYTVVVNAKDFAVQKAGGPGEPPPPPAAPAGTVQQVKREATRFLQIDPERAASELEKAERAVENEVDAALAALLGADLVRVDMSILKDRARRRGVNVVRTLIAFVVVVAAGLALGAVMQRAAPARSVSVGGLPGLVALGTPSALEDALEKAERDADEDDRPWVALAHALLLVEHGADEGHLQSAEDALASADAGRRAPPALLARALLATRPLAERDEELGADLEVAEGDPKLAENPYVLMALAERARAKGDEDAVVELLSRAGLSEDAPPRATHELARAFARKGQLPTAETLLERLATRHPRYTPALATALAVDVAALARELEKGKGDDEDTRKASVDDDGDDDESAKPSGSSLSSRPAVKRALAALDNPAVEAPDAAPLALVLAAIASAAKDAELHGRMLQRAQEGGVVARYPGLLSRLSQLMLLDLGDFPKVETMLSDGIRAFPGEIGLLVDRTRARVGRGLSGDRIRRLRTNAERRVEPDGLILPLGRFQVDFAERYLPLRPLLDAQIFPEDAIEGALDIEGITAQAAERRLEVVANLRLAQIALAQGDVDTATERVALARRTAGSDPEVHLTDALVQAKSGNAARAREAIEEAMRLAPDDPRVLVAAARLQVEAGDLTAARRSLARVSDEGYRSPTAVALEARIATKEQRYADARAMLEKARKMAPRDVSVLLAALQVEHAVGDFDAGLKVARELRPALGDAAERYDDLDPVTGAFLAWADAAAGDAKDAMKDLGNILDVRSGFAEGHYILGRVRESQGDKAGARSSYEEAARLGGSGPVTQAANVALARLDGRPPPDTVQESKPSPAPKRKPKGSQRKRGRGR